ncbi:Intradiol ring-cleavage dioxygenase [Leucosporidium creatinivorum]|uniref:Intradiol ring-cleavage dioxygenase n=1 Tax=Leucosporidium creatinivorum TaxID=106004 RepID=A0A1Y2G0P1_9BASI|nr:Intradiol ring-cleavage dioxygenase [Leucosporidium creatinivorum]
MKFTSALFGAAALVSAVAAHGDVHEPSTPEEVAAYHARQEQLFLCAPKLKVYNEQRRKKLQEQLGGIPSTDASTMFLEGAFEQDGSAQKTLECSPAEDEARMRNHSCTLTPQVTQGPYYHEAGHPIRQNMAEDQLGLLFYMDVGIIDVNTCEPVEGVLVDLWHANTTGHYAGHADPDPDLYWEGPAPYGVRKGLLTKFPRWNTFETWLRGAWPTNKNGVAQFTSIFPGYYTGRATHVHIKVHTKWEPYQNGTFKTGGIVHTGQFFVEDHINEVIDKIHPYTENPIKNKWGRTRNWDDSLKIYQESHQNGYFPTFELTKLGGNIQSGLYGQITVGVDMKKDYDRTSTNQVPYVLHEEIWGDSSD